MLCGQRLFLTYVMFSIGSNNGLLVLFRQRNMRKALDRLFRKKSCPHDPSRLILICNYDIYYFIIVCLLAMLHSDNPFQGGKVLGGCLPSPNPTRAFHGFGVCDGPATNHAPRFSSSPLKHRCIFSSNQLESRSLAGPSSPSHMCYR